MTPTEKKEVEDKLEKLRAVKEKDLATLCLISQLETRLNFVNKWQKQ